MNKKLSFQKILDGLNPEQRKAVDQIEGPVMVIAGPGTGKTQLLAARIGNILVKTDTRPHEILCVTFTEAGVHEMRERLYRFIGVAAYSVYISTFHSFCNHVIQKNPSYFGDTQGLRKMEELDQHNIVKSIIDDWPVTHPLKSAKAPYYSVPRILDLYKNMSKEGIAADHLIHSIEEEIERIKDDPDSLSAGGARKGKLKKTCIAVIESYQKTIEAVRAYPVYQKIKKERQLYDFDDMIYWVLKAFKENEDLLLEYSEQFQYYLIDEFQDNNGSQAELLYLMADVVEKPNIFIVGDDDQSIFRFQGANFTNILEFNQRYSQKDLHAIVLTRNYRSVPAILEAASKLIKNNKYRLVNQVNGLKKDLIASHPDLLSLEVTPKYRICENALVECAEIAAHIKRLHESCAVPYHKIAILYPKHKFSELLGTVLKWYNIPIHLIKKEDLLSNKWMRALIQTLNFISKESENPYMNDDIFLKIIHHPWYNIPSEEIAFQYRSWLNQKGEEFGEKYFQRWIRQHAKHEQIQKLFMYLDQWKRDRFILTPSQIIEKVYKESGFLTFILIQPEAKHLTNAIQSLLSHLDGYAERNPNTDIRQYLDVLQDMKEEGLRIDVKASFEDTSGVKLMTLYASKGRQFEHVFMMHCTSDVFENRRSLPSLKLPNLTDHKEDDEEEMRRLFFVGITRAEEGLYLSYPKLDSGLKTLKPSLFLAELIDEEGVEFIDNELSPDDVQELRSSIFWLEKPLMPDYDLSTWVNDATEQFKMSASALNTYLNCPIHFFYHYILKIPQAGNKHLGFGNAVHVALDRFLSQLERDDNCDSLIKYFKQAMLRNYSQFSVQEYKDMLNLGLVNLEKYYKKKIEHWKAMESLQTEKNISDSQLGDVPLTGKIDLIAKYKDQYTVIDFKTGSASNPKVYPPKNDVTEIEYLNESSPERKKDLRDKLLGSDYWRQLIFYKILLDGSAELEISPVKATLDFVIEEKKDVFKEIDVYFKEEDIAFVKEQIVSSYKKIKDKIFEPGCLLPKCEWCTFAQQIK